MPIFEFPSRNLLTTGTGTANVTISLTANGDYGAFIFAAEKSITLKKVGFRITTATNMNNKVIEISVQTVGSDGLPTGTTIIAENFTGTTTVPASSTWWEYTFSTTASLTRGTVYALVVKANDANWATAPAATLVVNSQLSGVEAGVLPYAVGKEAGAAAAKVNNRNLETFYLIDNSGTPAVYGWPFIADNNNTLAIGSTTVEGGMQFLIPTTSCLTYKVIGIKVATNTSLSATAPDLGLAIYDWNSGNNSTALETTLFPARNQGLTSAGVGQYEYYFDTPPTLNAGSRYIVSIYTTNSSFGTVTTLRGFDINDGLKPAMWDQTNDYEWNRVSRTSSTGSWTTTANATLSLTIMCDVVSLPSGSGLLVHPGMAGGMRG